MGSRRLWAVVGSCAVAAVVVGVAVWAVLPRASPGPDCSLPPPTNYPDGEWFTLASCPSTVSLAAYSYQAYEVPRLSDGETVTGAFVANVTVGAYLLNGSEMNELQKTPNPTSPPPAYLWSCGPSTSCNVTTGIPPSPVQCFVVIENLHAGPAEVTWTKTFSLYYNVS